MKLLKDGKSIKEEIRSKILSDILSVIDQLLEIDAIFADNAYLDASTYTAGSNLIHELDKECNKELLKALEKIDKGDFDKAIDHYKHIWEHAKCSSKKIADSENEGDQDEDEDGEKDNNDEDEDKDSVLKVLTLS